MARSLDEAKTQLETGVAVTGMIDDDDDAMDEGYEAANEAPAEEAPAEEAAADEAPAEDAPAEEAAAEDAEES